jgi:hypothetical protein
MNTYFIRHTESLDIDDHTRAMLFEEKRIAIHFPWTKSNPVGSEKDSDSLNPNDYETSGKKALNALLRLAKNGGYVCAQYYSYNKYLIGKIFPNSKIEIIKGVWGKRYDRSGKEAVLKSLQLKQCKLLEPYSYAQIHIGRPRQGTIMKWINCGDLIKRLVEDEEINFSNEVLDPLDQEIICQEFLRMENTKLRLPKLISLLGFPGRTMKDLDILGISDDNKKIFAQVTHLNIRNIGWKKNQLKKYSNKDSHLILFCDCTNITKDENITIFPIKIAIETFLSSQAGKYYKECKSIIENKSV